MHFQLKNLLRIALRTQQIVAEESGVTNTIDPLAGSYYVESMTDLIEKEAKEYIDKIDAMGGMTEAIDTGFVQTEIQKSAYKYEMEIEENERIIVGVNKYQIKEPEHKDLLKIDMKVQEDQIKFLKKIKSSKEIMKKLRQNLNALKKAAEGNDNLMPFIVDAVRVLCKHWRNLQHNASVFGEYKEHVVI